MKIARLAASLRAIGLRSLIQHPLARTSTFSLSTMSEAASSSSTEAYVPPKVWKYETSDGSKFTMNRPTAGARTEKTLPVGKHPIQLYSLATPNGVKVTVLLEELIEAGHDVEYDAWKIDIMKEDQFGNDFVSINPNSKVPAMRVHEPGQEPLNLFESGSILLYLAEKYKAFLPQDLHGRTATLNWLFWQMGSGPYVGGGFGHFFAYANEKQKYPIDRFTMETKRQLHVLELQLTKNKYIIGDEYTIADMAIWPWYGGIVLGHLYDGSKEFLNVEEEYPHLIKWAKDIAERPAVKRGKIVNKNWGADGTLPERHERSDFDNLTKPE